MGLRGRLVVFGFPALEILTAWGLASTVGWGWTLAVVLGGVPIGFVLMRSAGRSAMGELQLAAQEGVSPQGTVRHAARFAAGMLLALPGVWSDLAALLVLVPGSRRWMLQRLPITGYGLVGRGEVIEGDVIEGDVIEGDVIQGDVLRTRPAGPPGEDGPAGDQQRLRELPG